MNDPFPKTVPPQSFQVSWESEVRAADPTYESAYNRFPAYQFSDGNNFYEKTDPYSETEQMRDSPGFGRSE